MARLRLVNVPTFFFKGENLRGSQPLFFPKESPKALWHWDGEYRNTFKFHDFGQGPLNYPNWGNQTIQMHCQIE